MKIVKILAFVLTVIGAINWGLVGILKFDLVAAVFGEMSTLSRLVYSIVGVSGVITLLTIYS
ncbi:MAG: DUF378 domain-containing protein, partial [Candidatus Gastranaerophilales bacterium]|nr:DUF378 domain-containing protein [Candidatus Gastranaerophilales bacterium]